MDDFEEHGISLLEDSDSSDANCSISDYVPSKDVIGEHSVSKDSSSAESEGNRIEVKQSSNTAINKMKTCVYVFTPNEIFILANASKCYYSGIAVVKDIKKYNLFPLVLNCIIHNIQSFQNSIAKANEIGKQKSSSLGGCIFVIVTQQPKEKLASTSKSSPDGNKRKHPDASLESCPLGLVERLMRAIPSNTSRNAKKKIINICKNFYRTTLDACVKAMKPIIAQRHAIWLFSCALNNEKTDARTNFIDLYAVHSEEKDAALLDVIGMTSTDHANGKHPENCQHEDQAPYVTDVYSHNSPQDLGSNQNVTCEVEIHAEVQIPNGLEAVSHPNGTEKLNKPNLESNLSNNPQIESGITDGCTNYLGKRDVKVPKRFASPSFASNIPECELVVIQDEKEVFIIATTRVKVA
uniref:Uncharacterized protein n=1 Tax=Oryza punctata TaxID=4537 RepID=A0A0E0MFC4_ORYPU